MVYNAKKVETNKNKCQTKDYKHALGNWANQEYTKKDNEDEAKSEFQKTILGIGGKRIRKKCIDYSVIKGQPEKAEENVCAGEMPIFQQISNGDLEAIT